MSKSKKNTIDPEIMIEQYSADAVRWFILSDSPPEKDVQWSAAGVVSSSKFLQKIWNLNQLILNKAESKINKSEEENFMIKIDLYIYRIDKAINEFQFNVAIAQFYEVYNYLKDTIELKISNKILKNCMIKIMKFMIPFTPHLAHECLSNLNCDEFNTLPKINKNILDNIKINMVVQINGKTRDVLNIEKDLTEAEVNKLIKNSPKANKYLGNTKIVKTIFVKNKIINYILNS